MSHKKEQDDYKFSEFEQDFLSVMNDGALPQKLLKMLIPIKNLDVKECLEVYTQAKTVRLCDTLYENFSACAKVLGDDDFFALANDYVATHSSEFYNLEDYGHEFPAFLAEQDHCDGYPFLPELATFEWTFKEVFHGKFEAYDVRPKLEAVSDFSKVVLTLQSSMALIHSEYRIKEIWDLRNGDEADVDWEPLLEPSWLLLYRGESSIFMKDLSPLQFSIFELLQKGLCIGDLMEELSKEFEDPDSNCIQQTFQFLVANALISQIDIKS